MDFDKYEPYSDYDKKGQEDICISTDLGHSPSVRESQEKPETEHVDQLIWTVLKSQNIRSLAMLVEKWDIESKNVLLCLDGDVGSTELQKNQGEVSTSRNGQRLLGYGYSSEARLTHRDTEKDYQEKKHISQEYRTSEKHQLAKVRCPCHHLFILIILQLNLVHDQSLEDVFWFS